jgi:hypothetical protein
MAQCGITLEKHSAKGERRRDVNSPGAILFADMRLMQLTEQQRARSDVQHTNMLTALCNPEAVHPVSAAMIKDFPVLGSDAHDAVTFKDAKVIVTGNTTRAHFNLALALRHADSHGLPVFFWLQPVSGISTDAAKVLAAMTLDQLIAVSPRLLGIFVVGAPGTLLHTAPGALLSNRCVCVCARAPLRFMRRMRAGCLLKNINPSRCLANGNDVVLHSITFCASAVLSEREASACNTLVSAAKASDRVLLPHVPSFINVRVPPIEHLGNTWRRTGTLVPGAAVIPIAAPSAHSGKPKSGKPRAGSRAAKQAKPADDDESESSNSFDVVIPAGDGRPAVVLTVTVMEHGVTIAHAWTTHKYVAH